MSAVCVIGIGSVLRGDDAVGWIAAERLAKEITSPHVQVIPCHQLMPELAEPISESDTVIFIDATEKGEPGTWRCEKLPAPDPKAPGPLTHHFDPATLLAWTLALHRRSPEALLVSITAESFDFSDELTPKVKAAFEDVVRFVRQSVNDRLAK